jgi:hypothetical protein
LLTWGSQHIAPFDCRFVDAGYINRYPAARQCHFNGLFVTLQAAYTSSKCGWLDFDFSANLQCATQ